MASRPLLRIIGIGGGGCMKHLYLISKNVNNGYDTYNNAVVCANNEEEARETHPGGKKTPSVLPNEKAFESSWLVTSWCLLKDVKVKYIGDALDDVPIGVVCASFEAG